VATPTVTALYRRRVVQLMGTGGGGAASPVDAGTPASATQTSAAVQARDGAAAPVDAPALVDAARQRIRQLRNALVAACAVYAVFAGVLLTLGTDLPGPRAWPLPARLVADVLLIGTLCIPLVLVGIAHPRFARLYWRRFVPLFVAAAALRTAATGAPAADVVGAALVAALFGIPVLALFYAAVMRRLARQVGPLLVVPLAVAFGTLSVWLSFSEAITACPQREAARIAFGLSALVVLPGVPWLAWRSLRALAHAFERKALGDAQVQIASALLVVTAVVVAAVAGLDRRGGPWVPGLGAGALGAFAVYLAGLRRLAPWAPPRRLLLLRVFAHDERGERLLDETSFRWRFVGPIQLIGGPDMAQQTLDPQELLLFVRGRAREQFVTGAAELAERLRALDLAPDRDGRYRLAEFFCYDDVWQAGVEALARRSDAVLLDLRGFTEARRGTAFEVALLARLGALPRTVCLVDAQTDRDAVRRAIVAAGTGSLDDARVLDAGGGLDAAGLFAALAEAAGRARPA
jgi:hypothetical protein